jgi:hydrogenase nickel incorporation protein HypB
VNREITLSHLAPALEQRGRIVTVEKAVMSRNNEIALQNRERFERLGIFVLNVMSSPGSGKTAFLARTLEHLRDRVKAAVIVGDLATDNDAERLSLTGADTVQIQTGNVCHLEADMVSSAVQALDLEGCSLLVIENVGNLVCPAGYDLGEAVRVVLLSVTEGEDKPLKYPKAFRMANVVIVNKIDLADAVQFERSLALENIRKIAPQALIFEVSARTGQGMEGWYAYLESKLNTT